MRSNGECLLALIKVVFLALGVVGLLASWPLWLCIVFLVIGGIWLIVDSDGDIEFW